MNTARNYPINCGLAASNFTRQFTKQPVSARSFDLSVRYEPRIVQQGTQVPAILGDLNIIQSTQNVTVSDAQLIATPIAGQKAFLRRASTSNASAFLQDSQNFSLFRHQAPGVSLLSAELSTGETQVISATATASSPQTVDAFVSFLPGSLSSHIYQTMQSVCNGSTNAPGHYAYYSTYNDAAGVYARNNSCWMSGFDLSGVCVLTGSGNTRMCTAITPHHAIGIKHASFHPQIGEAVTFAANNGETVTRTVQNVAYVANVDCSVIRFSQALPDTVAKYRLMPTSIVNYLPNNRNFYNSDGSVQVSYQMHRCPVIVVSHYIANPAYVSPKNNRFVYVRDVSTALLDQGQGSIGDNDVIQKYSQWFPDYGGAFSGDAWGSPIRPGDSGGPSFAIINQELVLLGLNITAVSTSSLAAFAASIQTTINTLGPGGQTYQTVDLSQFTNFAS